MATAQVKEMSRSLLQSYENQLASDGRLPACSEKSHVQAVDATKTTNLLEALSSPHFSTMDDAAKSSIIEALSQSLSPSSCMKVRSAAKQNALKDLAARCDLYIDDKLPDMLSREDVLSLPRIQVNVRVSSDTFELGSDLGVIEELAPKVVQNLKDNCSTHLEENVLEMHMTDDFLFMTNSNSSKMLSPEKLDGSLQYVKKMDPSPARKLILGSSCDSDCDDLSGSEDQPKSDKWRIVSTHKLSELNAVCVVDCSNGLVLVNIALILNIENLPVSPTTGLPFLNGTSFIAPMTVAKSGFGVVSFDDTLLSVGGFNRDGCIARTERYNFGQNCWESVSSLNTKRARLGVVTLGETVYAIGGSDGRRELASVETFDPTAEKWKLHESKLITPRSCFGATTLDGCIYVVGGLYYSTPLKTAEVFNPSINRWEALPSMSTWRRDVAVATCSGKIYAIGGQTSGWSCLASVESFDPATRRWTKVPSMKIPRRNATAVTVDDKIYVIGGYNGSSAVRHVEVYDPATSTWAQFSSLNVKRSYPAAAVLNESIFVVGGYAGSSFLNSVERFDCVTNLWTSFV